MKNLFADLPRNSSVEVTEILVQSNDVRIERIVSVGHSSPKDFWYDQEQSEWVMLLTGQASLRIEGQPDPIQLIPGDHLNLPAHCKHRVEWTSPDEPTIWLAVFYARSNDG